MDLINRYLQAIKFWLPKDQKQDIIAELSEDLRSQIDDREAELGRKLNESEVADMLKQRGRPVLVANCFLPQDHLIGPVLFPIYLFCAEDRSSVLHGAVGPGLDRDCSLSRRAFRPESDCLGGIVLDCVLAHGVLHDRKHHHRFRDSGEDANQIQVSGAMGSAQTATRPRS